MTAQTAITLRCDGAGPPQCYATITGPGATVRLVREDAARFGWTLRMIAGKRADLCPQCGRQARA